MTNRRAAPIALSLFALTLSPLAAGAARAQTSPDGAKTLELQIHSWLASTLGPNAKIAQRPIRVVAAGDHYDLTVPLGDAADAPLWTAIARPQSGGRWQIDNIHIPSPAEFHVKLPEAMAQGAPPGMTGPNGEITYKLSIGEQSAQMLLDPTFATTTTTTSSVRNLDLQSTGGMSPQTIHLDRGNSSFVIQPAADGRIDVAIDSNLDGYRVDQTIPNQGSFKLAFGKTHLSAAANSLSRERATQILQAAIQFAAVMNHAASGNGDAGAPPPSPAAMLEALADLATGASIDETLQDVAVDIGGMAGVLRAAQIGFAIKGAGGLLDAHLNLGAEGLTLPDVGLGSMAELIPTKVSLRPTVSGIPAQAAMALAKASSDGDDPTPDDIMALFARGPISAGIESMTVAVAGAEFSGLGKLQIASPQDISGTAQITATHLDALQQRIAAEPSLAQAGPAIIFLKGIGRSVGDQMVWDITYRGGHVLVNNQDLTALAGGGSGAAPPDTPPQPPASGRPQLRRRQ